MRQMPWTHEQCEVRVMSHLRPSHLIISLVITISLAGCGNKNDKAVFSSDDGHPSGWVKAHNSAAKADIESCKTCHGDNYRGGISAASCMSKTSLSGFTCHVTSPAANLDNCLSCHGGKPSGPFGDANDVPNRKSAHTKHTALPDVDCATCHLNAGDGTASHAKAKDGGYRKATVFLSQTFIINSTSGSDAYNYNNGTCANVSCHGGITTPVWAIDKIVLVAGDDRPCLTCHEPNPSPSPPASVVPGVPQFNSFYSGYNVDVDIKYKKSTHAFHRENQKAKCTDCHNIGKLTDYQIHYSGIKTKTFTAPGMTVGGGKKIIFGSYSTYSPRFGNYSTGSKKCSNVSCHNGFGGSWVKGP